MTYSLGTYQKLRRGLWIVTAMVVAAILLLETRGGLAWLENRSSDFRAKVTADGKGDRDIVIIDIDNASYSSLTSKMGRWPWTRRVWTEVLRYLIPGEPKLVLFDILFSGQEEAADARFAETIAKAGNVVLPFAFVSGGLDTSEDAFTPPAKAKVAVSGGSPGTALDRAAWSLNGPETTLESRAAATGSNLGIPDADGRRCWITGQVAAGAGRA